MTPITALQRRQLLVQRASCRERRPSRHHADGTVRRCERAIGGLRHPAHEVAIALTEQETSSHRDTLLASGRVNIARSDGRDIYGDGVNVAARLEALAKPGGICVSRMVRDQVRDKLAFSFEDMGEQPMRVHRIVLRKEMRPSAPATGTSTSLPLALPDKLSIAVLPFQNMSGDLEQEYCLSPAGHAADLHLQCGIEGVWFERRAAWPSG